MKSQPISSIVLGVLVFLFCINENSFGQSEVEQFNAKNSIYVELGGSGFLYSINYDRIFKQYGKLKVAGRAGFSYFRQSGGNPSANVSAYWTPVLPLELTAFWGRTKHHVELGSGVTFFSSRNLTFNAEGPEFFERNISVEALIPFRLGYRYQKPEGGFFFRVGYTPAFNLFLGDNATPKFHPLWGGISIGKSF